MNIRNAILAAADAFERGDRRFNFFATRTPGEGSATACYVGEIAYHLGIASGFSCGSSGNNAEASIPIVGIGFGEFCARMETLQESNCRGVTTWCSRGTHNAPILRAYADKYHPAERTATVPDWNAIASSRTVPDDVQLTAHQVTA